MAITATPSNIRFRPRDGVIPAGVVKRITVAH
jgi:hypothetical protein